MKKVLYSFLLFASISIFAQKNPATKFAIANGNVGTVALFEANKQYVQSINMYKNSAALPQDLKKFSFLAENGLASVKFKKDYGTLDSISLSELNKQNGLAPETPAVIDGYEFNDTKITIFANLMENAQVKDYNGKKTIVITSPKK